MIDPGRLIGSSSVLEVGGGEFVPAVTTVRFQDRSAIKSHVPTSGEGPSKPALSADKMGGAYSSGSADKLGYGFRLLTTKKTASRDFSRCATLRSLRSRFVALEPLGRSDHFLDVLLEYPAIVDVFWMRDFMPNVHRLFELLPALIPESHR